MIKNIVLRNNNKIVDNEINIDFDKHINVIIGPKGGGKSTLFFLLAGLEKYTMYDIVKEALKEYGFEFLEARTFGGEIIKTNQLSEKKIKINSKSGFDDRNDVIYQDDAIKKELINSESIKKDKMKYIEKQINISEDFSKFIDELRELHTKMEDLYNLNDQKNIRINWSMLFEIPRSKINNNLGIINKINYDSKDFLSRIEKEIKEWKQSVLEIENFNITLEEISKIKSHEQIKDEKFEHELNNQTKKIKDENIILMNLIKNRINSLIKYKRIVVAFSIAYKRMIEKIKTENSKIAPIELFINQSGKYFAKMGRLIRDIINKFEYIRTFDKNFKIENEMNQEENKLAFDIPSNIKFSEEEIIQILKSIFYKGDSLSDTRKWLEKLLEKGVYDFDISKIKKSFSTILENKTKVLIEGKDYETLSLGQKSIYGLKYKFNKSKNDDLFMDQPEDNLDNNTIAEEVLPLINQKKQQVFIVTHNANIGILSNPERIIVCDLNCKENPYRSINFKEEINKESVNFLEGGIKYLEERFNKIIKGE